jgi:Galactose oxidase, central domain
MKKPSLKAQKSHPRIERPRCINNRISLAKQAAGMILALVGLISAATLATGPISPASAQEVARSWSRTGSFNTARYFHTATLLSDGKVLVAGGTGFSGDVVGFLDSAELYDPATGKWNATGGLNVPRTLHTATLLKDGKVLIVGGIDGRNSGSSLNAELYDPDTGALSNTGHLKRARFDHRATLLPDGKVLVAGGEGHRVSGGVTFQVALDSSELYDPDTGTWSFASNLNSPRAYHTATLLADGKALLVGGLDSSSISGLNSAELGDFVAVPPRIIMASVSGKRLIIAGENFDDGAVILINGEKQKTRNDDQNPRTTLIGKKAGNKIKAGDKLQVRNPDGTVSEEFTFAAP